MTNADDDQAGFLVSPAAGLVTTEGGSAASFTVALTSRPTANVVVALTTSNSAEGTVAPPSLTFTPQNWNVPQTATVTGVDDQTVDGDVVYTIVTGAAVSSDAKYAGLNPPDVSLVNQDNDSLDLQISNLTLQPAAGLTSGGTVVIKWTVTNIGSFPTPKSFNDLVVIKNTTTGQTLLSTPVLYDQNASGNGPIQPGGSRQRQLSFKLPDGPPGVGSIQFTTTVNYLHEIIESDSAGTNNTASVTQTSALAAYADLTVANLPWMRRAEPRRAARCWCGGTMPTRATRLRQRRGSTG